jgi:hypothetical protein
MSAQDNLNPQQFFHGTDRKGLKYIRPADQTSSGTVHFPDDTDPAYAYASDNPHDAGWYAHEAHIDSGNGRHVYQVEPLGAVENDPRVDDTGSPRNNFAGDYRSREGFRVVRRLGRHEWGDNGTPHEGVY